MKITRAGAVIALSIALLMPVFTLPTQASEVYMETEGIPPMKNPVKPNNNGVVELQSDALLDFIIPDTINGVTVDAIGAYAFEGCELIRTVSIPASVTEIGECAFSDCPYLQTIILKNRSDMQDLSLGANWSGDAQVICEYTRKAPAMSAEELNAIRQVLADAEGIHEISEENLLFAKNQLAVLQEIHETLQDKAPNSDDAISFDAMIQRLSRLIREFEASIQFTEPPTELIPDDSQVISENRQDTVDEPIVSDSDGSVPENLPQEPFQPVEEIPASSTPPMENVDMSDTSAPTEPSEPGADAALQEVPAVEPQQ